MLFFQGLVLEVSDAPALADGCPEGLSSFIGRTVQFDFEGFRVAFVCLGLGLPEQRPTREFPPDIFCFLLKEFSDVFFHSTPRLHLIF